MEQIDQELRHLDRLEQRMIDLRADVVRHQAELDRALHDIRSYREIVGYAPRPDGLVVMEGSKQLIRKQDLCGGHLDWGVVSSSTLSRYLNAAGITDHTNSDIWVTVSEAVAVVNSLRPGAPPLPGRKARNESQQARSVRARLLAELQIDPEFSGEVYLQHGPSTNL